MIGGRLRTPLARVRGLGSAQVRHRAFLAPAPDRGRQRAADHRRSCVIVVSLLGRNHAAALQILGSPLVAIIMLLFIGSVTYHMRIGMQVDHRGLRARRGAEARAR